MPGIGCTPSGGGQEEPLVAILLTILLPGARVLEARSEEPDRVGGMDDGDGARWTPRDGRAVSAVTAAVRDAIVSGTLGPNERLVEADLATRYGVSRGTIRSVLVELASEHLVIRPQNRGARVRAITLTEAVEISEVRMVMEGLCAAKAAEHATEEDHVALRELIEGMADAVACGDVVRYSALNQSLHKRIREAGRQATAAALVSQLRNQSVHHQFRVSLLPGRPAESLDQHRAIVDAIVAGDRAGAEMAMRSHLASVIEALRDLSSTRVEVPR